MFTVLNERTRNRLQRRFCRLAGPVGVLNRPQLANASSYHRGTMTLSFNVRELEALHHSCLLAIRSIDQ